MVGMIGEVGFDFRIGDGMGHLEEAILGPKG